MAEDVQPSRNTPHVDEPLTDRLKGGVIITVIALLLVLATFYISNPTVPRVMAILTGVVGVAVIAGLVPVRGPQDFYGGLALVLFGTFALIASAELPGQRGFAFGPGTAPRLFAMILALVGAAVTVIGALSDGRGSRSTRSTDPRWSSSASRSLPRSSGRSGWSLRPTLPSWSRSWIEGDEMGRELDRSGAMTLGCVLLFVYLLNLPFQLWPQANAPQLLLNQFADLFKSIFAMLAKLIPGLN